MNAHLFPPLTREDRLPDHQSVWRSYSQFDGKPPHGPGMDGHRAIRVQYAGGLIERTWIDKADWLRVVRWRWGWAPA